MININNDCSNKCSFKARLDLNVAKKAFDKNQIAELKNIVSEIGKPDDLIKIKVDKFTSGVKNIFGTGNNTTIEAKLGNDIIKKKSFGIVETPFEKIKNFLSDVKNLDNTEFKINMLTKAGCLKDQLINLSNKKIALENDIKFNPNMEIGLENDIIKVENELSDVNKKIHIWDEY